MTIRHWTALLMLVPLVVTACGDSGEASVPDTPQAFIDELDAALDGEDQVLHTTVTSTGGEGGSAPESLSTSEIWIYGAEDQARNHFNIDPDDQERSPQTVVVIDGNQIYYKSANGQVDSNEWNSAGRSGRTCPLVESTPFIHQIAGLFCARFTPQEGEVKEIEARVDADAEFEGTDAVALVYEARNELEPNATPEPERVPELTTTRFYVDAETFLPLGWTVEMRGEPLDLALEITGVYSNEFIPRDQLPDDYFHPNWIDDAEPAS